MLRKGFENGDLDLETVWICLERYREFRLNRLSEPARIDQIKADRVGGLTLDWLWKDKARWADVLSHKLLFFDTVCYYLVAEGLQDYILGIIKLDVPAPQRLAFPYRWRGFILRSLVKAVLDTETEGSADRAIKLFMNIHDEVLTLKAQSESTFISGGDKEAYATTSLHPACVELSGRLVTNSYPKTSESHFRRFIAANYGVPRVAKSQELSCAVLPLYIPNAPEPDSALRLFKEWFGELRTARDPHLLGRNPKSRKPVYFALCRLETVLRAQNRSDDTSWVARTRDVIFQQAEQHNFRKANRFVAAGGDMSIRKVTGNEVGRVTVKDIVGD